MNRTHYCGALRESEIGREVTVCGWVLTKRDMGGVVFIDLRDREGVLQTVFDASALTPDEFRVADGLKNQSVIEVTGLIRKRGEETYNPKLATGTIELAANKIKLLSSAETLPFALDDSVDVREDLRLKYRFLDLRRPEMYRNLKFRHELVRVTRSIP